MLVDSLYLVIKNAGGQFIPGLLRMLVDSLYLVIKNAGGQFMPDC